MKKVIFLAMHETMAGFVSSMDIFYQAGLMWNSVVGKEVTPFFDVKVVTTAGEPFTCRNGVRMIPDGSIYDVRDSDLIVVTSISDIDQTLQIEGEVIDWLKDRYGRGSHIATICTGAFVLAETGLIDGKTATTHWCHANKFATRYPQIKLKPERLITDEGDLFCSGGFNSGIDLSLYLVGKILRPPGRLGIIKVCGFRYRSYITDALHHFPISKRSPRQPDFSGSGLDRRQT